MVESTIFPWELKIENLHDQEREEEVLMACMRGKEKNVLFCDKYYLNATLPFKVLS